jgi:hypothetical protein
MKTKALVFTVIAMAIEVFAGPSTSGGGFAVVCRNAKNQIQAAELLDIFEARITYEHQLFESSGDALRDYVRAVNNGYRLQGYNPPASETESRQYAINFMNHVQWLPRDEKLPNLLDTGATGNIPEGCALEPLAVFYDYQKQIIMDQEIWEKLDSRSQAGLIIHEMTYWYLRQMALNPDANSQEARLMTATNFTLSAVPARSGLPPNAVSSIKFHDCQKVGEDSTSCTQATEYYNVNFTSQMDHSTGVRLQFTYLAGRPLKTKTTLDLPLDLKVGDVYPIHSQELLGWTAEVVNGPRPTAGSLELVIRRGNEIMVVIP